MTENLPRIWIIGGTTEGLQLSTLCCQHQLPCTVTVTTLAAADRYGHHPNLRVRVNVLQENQLESFFQAEMIRGILDVSHPHAREISLLAIRAAQKYDIPYLRFERLNLEPIAAHPAQIFKVNQIEQLITEQRHLWVGRRVMLMLGTRMLPLFQRLHGDCQLFARVLPRPEALKIALDAGFLPERLIALRPPIIDELELALWQQWQIEVAVTKASGKPGGEDTKRRVAASLNIPLIMIERPTVDYPKQTDQLSVAIQFCQQVVNQHRAC